MLSNGKKMSEVKDAATGLFAVRWLQDKPHVTYLIALCAGYFKKVEDEYRDIPMAFWTPASQIGQAQNILPAARLHASAVRRLACSTANRANPFT